MNKGIVKRDAKFESNPNILLSFLKQLNFYDGIYSGNSNECFYYYYKFLCLIIF